MLLSCLLSVLAAVQDDSAALQHLLDEAVQTGRSRVEIPPGRYRLSEPLWLRGARDLEISARGVELVLVDPAKGGLKFTGCRNIRLTGLGLRHETPPFTQGRIAAIAADERSYDVRLDAGYPELVERPTGYVFEPRSRQIRAGSTDVTASRVERLGDGLFRLHFPRKSGASMHAVEVGDRMAFRGQVATDLYIGGSAGITVEDLTIRNGGGFCIHEDGGEGGNRYKATVTYGPKPAGAEEPPLLSCNADAFHSSGVRRGPTLDGCLFEGMGDDGVAIHGSYALLVEAREKSWVVTDGVLREGDPLRLITPEGGLAGEARVVSVRGLKDYAPAGKSRFHGFADLSRFRFAEVTTEPGLPAGFDWQASNPAAAGSGYVVRHTVIRNHRARGLLLKADDGLVEGNTIDGSTTAGIVLAP
ncbi:MAG TPA: hypothetical protein VE981_01620, partial [Planctomycetota bacterium]|nr:hypothetical protein [Planctomycetota bacterium]